MIKLIAIHSILLKLKRSFVASAGTIVFGMEDGTVSIFGLIFGVAATTTHSHAVLIAGAAGAAAAAVSMMAGVYLDAETSRDRKLINEIKLQAESQSDRNALLLNQLEKAGLTGPLSTALAESVKNNSNAMDGLVSLLNLPLASTERSPSEQAIWMLFTDFLSAAIPILPFVLFPISQARFVSAIMTTLMLIILGFGRAKIAKRSIAKTIAETVFVGAAAAVAGVGISMFVDTFFD